MASVGWTLTFGCFLLGWQPYVRDGDLLAKRYFQVYFANKVMVYEVEVEQKAPTRTTRLKLSYSDDGVSFVDGSEVCVLKNVQAMKMCA